MTQNSGIIYETDTKGVKWKEVAHGLSYIDRMIGIKKTEAIKN